jgi:integrase
MDDELKRLARELLTRLDASDGNVSTGPAVPLQATLAELLALTEPGDLTRDQYERGLRYFEVFLGRSATSADLTHDNLNAWFHWLQQHRGCGAVTVKNHRGAICRIWNYLAQDGVLQPYLIRKLRTPKIKRKPVESWTTSQVEQLLTAAAAMKGQMRNGIPTSLFVRAILLLAYDSWLRPVDLRRLQWQNIDFAKSIATIVQHKTGNSHSFAIGAETLNALKAIVEPRREVVFPLAKSGMESVWRRLYAEAKSFGFIRKKGQGLGTLRKTHATAIYREHGLAAAAESLGHVSGSGIASRHYVDAGAMYVGKLPPRLKS